MVLFSRSKMQRRASTGGTLPTTNSGKSGVSSMGEVDIAPVSKSTSRRARRSSIGGSLRLASKEQVAAPAPETAVADAAACSNRRRQRRASFGASISNWFQGRARKDKASEQDQATTSTEVYYAGEPQATPVQEEEQQQRRQEPAQLIIDHVEIVGLELLKSAFSADDIDDFSYDSYCQDSYCIGRERFDYQHQQQEQQQRSFQQLHHSFSQYLGRLESWEEDLDDAKEKYGYEGSYGNSFRRSKSNSEYDEPYYYAAAAANSSSMMQQHTTSTTTRSQHQLNSATYHHPRRRYSTDNNSSSSLVRRGSMGGDHARRGSADSSLRSMDNNCAHNCIGFERYKALAVAAATRRGSDDSSSTIGFERYKATRRRGSLDDSYANDSMKLPHQQQQRRRMSTGSDYSSIGFEQYKASQQQKRRRDGSMGSFSSHTCSMGGGASSSGFDQYTSTARRDSNNGSFANDSIENYGHQLQQQKSSSRRDFMDSRNNHHRSAVSMRNLSIGTGCTTSTGYRSYANDSIGNYGRQRQQLRRGSTGASMRNLSIGSNGCISTGTGGSYANDSIERYGRQHQQQQLLRRGSMGNNNSNRRSHSMRSMSIGSTKSSSSYVVADQQHHKPSPCVRRMSNSSLNSTLSHHTSGMNRTQ